MPCSCGCEGLTPEYDMLNRLFLIVVLYGAVVFVVFLFALRREPSFRAEVKKRLAEEFEAARDKIQRGTFGKKLSKVYGVLRKKNRHT